MKETKIEFKEFTKTKAYSIIHCRFCGNPVIKCDGECGENFNNAQEIYCHNFSSKHYCEECSKTYIPGD